MGALKSERCSRGHRMVVENLYMRPNGKRECLTCKRERNRGRKSDASNGSESNGGSIGRSISSPRVSGRAKSSIEAPASKSVGRRESGSVSGDPIYDHQKLGQRVASFQSFPVPPDFEEESPVKLCRNPDCGRELVASKKGFWYCPDVNGCSLGGQQQGKVSL